jgi:hypothetical protein
MAERRKRYPIEVDADGMVWCRFGPKEAWHKIHIRDHGNLLQEGLFWSEETDGVTTWYGKPRSYCAEHLREYGRRHYRVKHPKASIDLDDDEPTIPPYGSMPAKALYAMRENGDEVARNIITHWFTIGLEEESPYVTYPDHDWASSPFPD